MPYIKQIKMSGFKSFGPTTTTITLDKGFTVLTGPNGSGKTNIVDAVLFVLGEASARRLRSDSFAKLLYNGGPSAEAEKARGAKVVIQFDNSDNRIPLDTNTVTVSREVNKSGQSIYRLNGRKATRSRIVDVLSMAGISPTGHNVVMQGTITRMAEVAPHERRKILEDLIGIAQYDAEKAEAEEKLRAAEISIKTAMGRVDEVQRRVNDLERERNELLRYNFIQGEIKRFEAIKISHEILRAESKIADIASRVGEVRGKLEKLRDLREKSRFQRREVEREWRKFSSQSVEEGGTRVLKVQIKIGDLKSKLTELTTKISAGTASLEGLKRVRENSLQQLEAIQKDISETVKRVRQLKREHDRLSKEMTIKQAQHEQISKEAAQIREGLGENGRKIRELEQQLDKLYQKIISYRSDYTRSKMRIRVLSRRLTDLTSRRNAFASTLNDLKKSIVDLKEVEKEQETRLESIQRDLDRKITQKESIAKELSEAERIAGSAREAVVEFATQRELAEKIAAEEKALRNIEELGELGAIEGVYGRFRNLIKIESGYEKALEAAAAGWLDSIVVRDFNAAFVCAETLRNLKLGRIKIIPLQESSALKPASPPKIEGISGTASAFVKCAKEYEPAVTFVFGDTLTARDEKAALLASRKGYRAVTINGDLFEAGGGIESGYYRAPIDFSAIIPSEPAVKSLDEAVRALQEHLIRRQEEITAFEEEINRAQVEAARLMEASAIMESEITRVRTNIKRTKQNIRRIERYIQRSQEHLEKERAKMELQEAQNKAVQKEIRNLRWEIADLRKKTDPAQVQEMEIQREKLGETIITLQQQLGEVETELSTLRSKLENVLKIGSSNLKVQLRRVEQQFSTTEKEVEEALQQKEKIEKELSELEKSKEEMSRSILTAREEAKRFTHQIDEIDKQLHGLDAEYEQTNELFNQLQLSLQTCQLQLDQHRRRLMELGYEKPLEVPPEQLLKAESSLNLMKLELERLGAVNQLAIAHYDEQISRYKELSVRINELEKEKQAIISFMDEIERKKREVFMDAFNKVNESLRKYFSKLTGGGEAYLKLENTEDPFAGGIDMIVQFPAKPPILVSGASGGERSVAAVAFTFAVQDLMPAAFYILDEIDAHLDAFHVGKLGELLTEEAAKSQFIVITLKPEMVNKAEKVYGVYMHNGVSRVVSTTFREAAA
jgi:chromosome segregation protein